MRTLIVAALLTLATTAGATEIGTSKTKGIGLAAGVPSALTGKIYLNEKTGIAGYFGGSPNGSGYLRVQYDQEFVELADVEWSRMDLRWFAGGTLAAFPGAGLGLLGGVGGIGFDMQFHEFPLEVFAEAGPAVGVIPDFGLSFGFTSLAGARWYF